MDYKEKIIQYMNSNEVGQLYKSMLANLFPELAEIKDEKIKKGLVDFIWCITNGGLNNRGTMPSAEKCQEWLAWLEKQGEQKPVEMKWNELTWQDINTLERIINNVHYEFRNGIGEESFGEEVLERFRETKDYEHLDDIEKPVEWSEEDDQYLLVCKNALAKYQVSDKWDAGIISRWLENRLKSLRSKSHWKPTEEQLESLKNSFTNGSLSLSDIENLETLYEQLKAIKGE